MHYFKSVSMLLLYVTIYYLQLTESRAYISFKICYMFKVLLKSGKKINGKNFLKGHIQIQRGSWYLILFTPFLASFYQVSILQGRVRQFVMPLIPLIFLQRYVLHPGHVPVDILLFLRDQ